MIECCRQEIVNSIILKVKEAKYYSIIFDETTDVLNALQITLNIWYNLNNQVNEKVIGFIDCHKYIFDKKKEQQYDDDLFKTDEDGDNIVNNDQKFEPKLLQNF